MNNIHKLEEVLWLNHNAQILFIETVEHMQDHFLQIR